MVTLTSDCEWAKHEPAKPSPGRAARINQASAHSKKRLSLRKRMGTRMPRTTSTPSVRARLRIRLLRRMSGLEACGEIVAFVAMQGVGEQR